MLIGNDFVNAEDKYRRQVLRDQYPHKRLNDTRAGLAMVVTAMVVAVLLAACGRPEEAAAPVIASSQSIQDVAPAWNPTALLESILATYSGDITAVHDPEFGGKPAPAWLPNAARLRAIRGALEVTQSVGNTKPHGTPNYGLLQSILGSEPTSGPR